MSLNIYSNWLSIFIYNIHQWKTQTLIQKFGFRTRTKTIALSFILLAFLQPLNLLFMVFIFSTVLDFSFVGFLQCTLCLVLTFDESSLSNCIHSEFKKCEQKKELNFEQLHVT